MKTWTLAILLLLALPSAYAQDRGNIAFSVPVDVWTAGVALDAAGFVYTAVNAAPRHVLKFDPNSKQVARYDFDELRARNSGISGVAIAPTGKVYVFGHASNGEIPVPPDAFQPVCPAPGRFVARLDSGLNTLEAATFLCGSGVDFVSAIAIAGDGTVLVTGHTESPDFPVTPGAMRTQGENLEAFVTRLSGDLTAAIFSTYLGGSHHDAAGAIAADSAGNVYVTGSTLSPDFPWTPGAYVGDQTPLQKAFVTKIAADGSQLLYSAQLNLSSFSNLASDVAVDTQDRAWVAGTAANNSIMSDAFVVRLSIDGSRLEVSSVLKGSPVNRFSGIALYPGGGVVAAGETSTASMPVTSDAEQPCMANAYPGMRPGFDAMYVRFSEDGAVVHSSYLGGSSFEYLRGLAVDPQGSIYLTVSTTSRDFPFTIDPPPGNPLAFQSGNLTKIAFNGTGPRVACVVHAAALTHTRLSPGEIVTLYGEGLGPEEGIAANPSVAGSVPKTLGGAVVRFNGLAAPLLWVQNRQINAVTPFGITDSNLVTIEVVSEKGALPPVRVETTEMTPAIFPVVYSDELYGAILNQDFSVNSPSNPAKRGEVVMMYATGGGVFEPQPLDGEIISGPDYPSLAGQLYVSFDGHWADVLYAGAAPGFVAGAVQINARIPDNLPTLYDPHFVEIRAKEHHDALETRWRRVLLAIE